MTRKILQIFFKDRILLNNLHFGIEKERKFTENYFLHTFKSRFLDHKMTS